MLEEKIMNDYKEAMKARDTVKTSVLSFLRAEFKNVAIEKKKNLLEIITRLVFAIGVVFFTCSFIVNQTIYFSNYFGVSSFIISLIFLSIGTNFPELSLAIRV